MIELRNLEKVYTGTGRRIVALQGIDLTIEDGEIFGIIGLSGAGKSTLVRCINLLEQPTSGQVLLDGQDLTRLPHRELLRVRQNIGMIFQGFNLLEQRTVLGNVLFPLEIAAVPREEAKARALELLELVGLSDRVNSYPSQLSGGQKQRVAIARALATKPKYLLCDEATSALDPNTTRQILELLKEINRTLGVTIVIITHEMRVIEKICDRVAIIDASRIAEVGTVAEVFAHPRSPIGRQLILPADQPTFAAAGRKWRLLFDDQTADIPVLSQLILDTQAAISVLYADTRETGGRVTGQMILSVPEDEAQTRAVEQWLRAHRIRFEEVA